MHFKISDLADAVTNPVLPNRTNGAASPDGFSVQLQKATQHTFSGAPPGLAPPKVPSNTKAQEALSNQPNASSNTLDLGLTGIANQPGVSAAISPALLSQLAGVQATHPVALAIPMLLGNGKPNLDGTSADSSPNLDQSLVSGRLLAQALQSELGPRNLQTPVSTNNLVESSPNVPSGSSNAGLTLAIIDAKAGLGTLGNPDQTPIGQAANLISSGTVPIDPKTQALLKSLNQGTLPSIQVNTSTQASTGELTTDPNKIAKSDGAGNATDTTPVYANTNGQATYAGGKTMAQVVALELQPGSSGIPKSPASTEKSPNSSPVSNSSNALTPQASSNVSALSANGSGLATGSLKPGAGVNTKNSTAASNKTSETSEASAGFASSKTGTDDNSNHQNNSDQKSDSNSSEVASIQFANSATQKASGASATGQNAPVAGLNQRATISVINQVADKIALLNGAQASKNLTVHLQPADLGHVILNVASKGSEVVASIGVSNEDVQNALVANRDTLNQRIAQSNASITSVAIHSTAAGSQTQNGASDRHRQEWTASNAFGTQTGNKDASGNHGGNRQPQNSTPQPTSARFDSRSDLVSPVAFANTGEVTTQQGINVTI